MVLTPTTMAPPGFSHNFNDPTDDSLSNLSSGCYPRPTTMSSRLLLPPLYHDDITATAAASSTAALSVADFVLQNAPLLLQNAPLAAPKCPF